MGAALRSLLGKCTDWTLIHGKIATPLGMTAYCWGGPIHATVARGSDLAAGAWLGEVVVRVFGEIVGDRGACGRPKPCGHLGTPIGQCKRYIGAKALFAGPERAEGGWRCVGVTR